MLWHCDRVLIDDHGSTDATPGILAWLAEEYGERLTVTRTDGPFEQGLIVNGQAERAARLGATWVVPFDTDELWQGEPLRERLPLVDGDCVLATVYEHAALPTEVSDPLRAMVWRHQAPWHWPKAAGRAGIRYGLGHHDCTGTRPVVEGFEVRHFPWRTPGQARARVLRNVEGSATATHRRNYSAMARMFEDAAIFDQWYSGLSATEGCVVDPAEVRG